MNPAITIPETAVYADEAPGALVVPPNTSQYHAGVEPEMTLPAAWWNYFVKLFTETNIQASADIEAILTELNTLLISYGYTPNASLNNQLSTLFGRFLYGDNTKCTTKVVSGSLNDLARSGFYQYATVADYPGTLSAGIVMHAQFSDTTDSAIQFALGANGNTWFRAKVTGTWQPWARMWSSTNDGIGSGLDADLLHGKEFTAYSQVGPDGWPLIKGPVFGQVGQVGQSQILGTIGLACPAIVRLNATDFLIIACRSTAAPYLIKATVHRWDGSSWISLITPIDIVSTAPAPYTSATRLIETSEYTDLAVVRYTGVGSASNLYTYRWNFSAQTLTLIGTPFVLTLTTAPAICALSDNTVAIIQYPNLTTYQWNGTNWSQVGTIFTAIPNIAIPAMIALNSTDVVIIGSATTVLSVYRWNGTVWTKIGTDFLIGSTGGNVPALARLNSTDIMHIGHTNDILRCYRWNTDTLTWSAVGATGLTITGINYPAMAGLNATDVALMDIELEKLTMYKCI